jgi:3'-phosphoadenosine 5'-phosphosulfate sulfotransferase (PAPS reductase)/FAD synthetase
MNHVVALSGGKDSTAMALRLAEIEPRSYQYVCTPTGDEPPEMIEHWLHLGQLLGSKILPLMVSTLDDEIECQGHIPNFRQRWCTRMLKIEPFANYLRLQAPVTSYVGIRFDEPEREAGDYRSVPEVVMDFPLRRWRWTLHDVRSYLAKRGIQIPRRTDCMKCFFQRLDEWYRLWRDRPEVWTKAIEHEISTGHTFRTPGKDGWPTRLADLAIEFAKGRIPRRASHDSLEELQCRVCRL